MKRLKELAKMTESLSHLPEHKQNDLKSIAKIIRKNVKVEMIILFGSYARGDYVEYDVTHVDGSSYAETYQSDYDILVVLDNKERENHFFNLENKVVSQIYRIFPKIERRKTPVSLIFDAIETVNEKLTEGNSFYSDIAKEGIWLYNSSRFKLSKRHKLSPAERKKIAQRDFDYRFNKYKEHFDNYKFNVKKIYLNLASFHLHQTTESLFNAILLVFTGYSPKTHDLSKLYDMVKPLDKELGKVFPQDTDREKECFDLLRRSYVDARYLPAFTITEVDLIYLEERIKMLKELTDRICIERIDRF